MSLLVFFPENAKNLGRSDDAKRRKNGEDLRWPKNKLEQLQFRTGKYLVQKNQWPVTKTRATVWENNRPFVFFEQVNVYLTTAYIYFLDIARIKQS